MAILDEGQQPRGSTRNGEGTSRRILALLGLPLEGLARARGRLFPFVPVLLGLGIAWYLALLREPSHAFVWAAVILCAVSAGLWFRGPHRWRPVAAVPCLVLAGFLLILLRTHMVAAPVLSFRYYGPVEGRLVEIDRSGSDRLRLTLDQVTLARMAPDRTPERVRVSLMEEPGRALAPGTRIMLTGHLSPPGRPTEPGGFDFRRTAWFERLGAVGYSRTPVMTVAPSQNDLGLLIDRIRMTLSAGIRAHIPGDAGGFAAAVTTGDRSGISAAANDAMRDSNLSHQLSISGMHMSMLAAFIFAVVRRGLALMPGAALRLPTKKIAAAIALAASAFYLALAGRDVATERAFVMVAVMLIAVICDRRAISLRSIALAGVIVLLLRPESLTNAGFQMSFAATTALVIAFGWISGRARPWPRWSDGTIMLLFSSSVAGGATMPFTAAIFNRVVNYGLLANLLASPLMGVLVMPFAVVALLLAPLGLETAPLWLVGLGSQGVLRVAETVAGLDGVVSAVRIPPPGALPLVVVSLLWLTLWPGPSRWAGMVPLVMGGWLFWHGAARPLVLISESGTVSGLLTAEGRVLSRGRGDAFAVTGWLQRDGDLASAEVAARRPGMARDGSVVRYRAADREIVHITGRGAADLVQENCRDGALLLTSIRLPDGTSPLRQGACDIIDGASLERSGALALHANGGVLRILSVAEASGDRIWTRPAKH
ncbi:ComEC/Rec2 family competence protein [Haematobacter genomosp. 1]|uniref:Competence protein n=1 Tax=Haematobacter genomosp. 1 TaxID=366618 RepID=A0A212ACQ1_9RHOB|nr:ComEC/Rec2 family competence protein [Haematobacter genomosp. 1]OWJ78777.1 competence protein [Haematobacter genomosp. 1]